MTAQLTTRGLIVPEYLLKKLFAENYNQFLNKLTIKYEPKIGAPQITRLYEVKYVGTTRSIVLPRTYLQKTRKYIATQIAMPALLPIKADLLCELFEDQKLIISTLIARNFAPDKIASGEACALLNLGAGRGKTMIAAGLIAHLGVRAIYVVPKNPLADQAEKDMRGALSCSVARYCAKPGKKAGNVSPDVLIVVINSAILHPEIFADRSLVIFDEVHCYCSAKRKAIFRAATLPICFGMSATTAERKDGSDIVAIRELAFGGILYGDTILEDNTERFDCDVKIINYYGPDEHTKALTHESTDILFCHYMYQQFARDPYRVQLAMREIAELYNWVGPSGQTHLIYVFCEEIAPLTIMHGALSERFGDALECPEVKSLVGGIKSEQMTAIRESAHIILTTYGFSGTGISINHASAIVFLTPRKAQMKQVLARILRRGSDREIRRQVRDIVDARTPLKWQVNERKKAYEFYAMNVSELNVSWNKL